MHRFSLNIRWGEEQKPKLSSETCVAGGVEAYRQPMELQFVCKVFHMVLNLVVLLDKFNYNCLVQQLLQLF